MVSFDLKCQSEHKPQNFLYNRTQNTDVATGRLRIGIPYKWYIWRILSLAIRQLTQIGEHLVWRIGQGLP